MPPARPRPPLDQAIRDPGFTPRARDLDGLVDLLAEDVQTRHAERALTRLGGAAFDGLRTRFQGAGPPLRARVLRVIGRLTDEPRARTLLVAALDDADPKTRRNAAIALGHTRAEGVEEALLAAWERDPRPEMRRTVAASLGKVGGPRSLPVLRAAASAHDAELARIATRATMMVERTGSRADRGRIVPDRAPVKPVGVTLLARRGLEELLADELRSVAAVTDVRVAGPGRVGARLAGSMSALFAARTMLSFRFPLPTESPREGETVQDAIAWAAASDAARAVFDTWTEGAVRYRIAWAEGGHRRAATWGAAAAIARRQPELVNDPTGSLWELVVAGDEGLVDVSLAPRAVVDPRFAWRRGDVPAASHPTIAAALARVAGVRADDVVWDPFVGSGAELVERGRLGPYRSLRGSDLEPRALTVARENLTAAGLAADLELADALALAPAAVTLVITNPPMGRRASRTATLADTLDRFVAHAAAVLVPGGRLVWIAPWPQRARDAAARAGLTLAWSRLIDMGGFDAEMQRWIRS
ncbi:MAG TPA: HEAT repeat domain-containing protein [Polyangiaceae bacterium]